MRLFVFALLTLSTAAFAQAPIPKDFSKTAFEQRFRAADTDRDGRLTREQAYAAFPRMPAFFDEIDQNKDGKITLKEVDRALQRRVDAALSDSSGTGKYVKPADLASTAPAAESATPATPVFSSKKEAERYHRYQYYESLAASHDGARIPSDAVPGAPQGSTLNKAF